MCTVALLALLHRLLVALLLLSPELLGLLLAAPFLLGGATGFLFLPSTLLLTPTTLLFLSVPPLFLLATLPLLFLSTTALLFFSPFALPRLQQLQDALRSVAPHKRLEHCDGTKHQLLALLLQFLHSAVA